MEKYLINKIKNLREIKVNGLTYILIYFFLFNGYVGLNEGLLFVSPRLHTHSTHNVYL